MGWIDLIGTVASKLKPSGSVSTAEVLAAIRLAKISRVLEKAFPHLKPAEKIELADIYARPGTYSEKLHGVGVFLAKKNLGMPAPLSKPTTWNEIEPYYSFSLKTIEGRKVDIRFAEGLLKDLRGNSLESTKVMTELIRTLTQKSSLSVQKSGSHLSLKWGEFSSATHNMSCEFGRDGAIIIKVLNNKSALQKTP